MWQIIVWVVVGALAGWIASKIMNRDSSMGGFANIVVGIIGALIGGFIVQLVGGEGFTGFNIWSLVVAIVGAIILLAIINLFTRGKIR